MLKEVQFFDYDNLPISTTIQVDEEVYQLLVHGKLEVENFIYGYWRDPVELDLQSIPASAIFDAYHKYCVKNKEKLDKAKEKRRQQFLKLKKEFE